MTHATTTMKYAKTHEWARLNSDGLIEVGISDHAQEELGDIVYLKLPEPGSQFKAGAVIAVIESVKAASDIHSPVSGEVTEVNTLVIDSPDTINQNPDSTWLFRLKTDNPAEMDLLMSHDQYVRTIS
jgi:glycine cleavage system H protein